MLLTSTSTRSQPDSITSSSTSFTAVFFTEGLPEFPPVKRMGLVHPSFVRVSTGDSAQTIEFVRGRGKTGLEEYWLVHHRPDNTVVLKSIDVTTAADSSLRSAIELEFDPLTHASSVLEIRLLPRYATLLYHWVGSSSASNGSRSVLVRKHGEIEVGKRFPSMSIPMLNGQKWENERTQGKILVLNWWSIGCTPCREEIPGLNTLVTKYAKRADIVFLAIASNTSANLRGFLQKTPFEYNQALGTETIEDLLGNRFPRNIVVDRENKIVYDETGATAEKYKEIERVIENLMAR
jgi:thiol-disulfide isomerase/thioredoxin